jgi:hypothetical protein
MTKDKQNGNKSGDPVIAHPLTVILIVTLRLCSVTSIFMY